MLQLGARSEVVVVPCATAIPGHPLLPFLVIAVSAMMVLGQRIRDIESGRDRKGEPRDGSRRCGNSESLEPRFWLGRLR